jgi:hypothetical protein
MRYRDLMEDSTELTSEMKQRVIDVLAPLYSNGVTDISLSYLITKLKNMGTGLKVDHEFMANLLDPAKFDMVDRVNGDTVYLKAKNAAASLVSKDARKSDDKKIADTATKKAVKDATAGL